jgi:hypothetical protein
VAASTLSCGHGPSLSGAARRVIELTSWGPGSLHGVHRTVTAGGSRHPKGYRRRLRRSWLPSLRSASASSPKRDTAGLLAHWASLFAPPERGGGRESHFLRKWTRVALPEGSGRRLYQRLDRVPRGGRERTRPPVRAGGWWHVGVANGGLSHGAWRRWRMIPASLSCPPVPEGAAGRILATTGANLLILARRGSSGASSRAPDPPRCPREGDGTHPGATIRRDSFLKWPHWSCPQ